MAEDARTRNLHVDTLRGVACILLVSFHVIVALTANDLLAKDSATATAANALAYVRMPLFTFLSGYVYAMKPFQGGWRKYLTGKARRLLIPMLVLGAALAIIEMYLLGSSIDTLLLLPILPLRHFWYVEALLWIFALVALLDSMKVLDRVGSFALIFLAVIPLSANAGRFVEYFAINGFAYLLPYFLLGVGMFRFPCKGVCTAIAAIAALSGATVVAWWIAHGVTLPPKESLVAIPIGCGVCVLLMKSGLRIPILAQLGAYSYSIYILHYFFTAPTRMALVKLGVESPLALGVAITAVGLLAPVVCEILVKRGPPIGKLILGISPRAAAA